MYPTLITIGDISISSFGFMIVIAFLVTNYILKKDFIKFGYNPDYADDIIFRGALGGILGAKKGSLSILCYIFEGAIGIPVFAGMKSGMHILVGPTAGDLWAFIIAAYITGLLTEKGYTKKPLGSFLSCFTATTLILVVGALYLAIFSGLNDALIMGFYQFLVGDVVKSSISAVLLTTFRKF